MKVHQYMSFLIKLKGVVRSFNNSELNTRFLDFQKLVELFCHK